VAALALAGLVAGCGTDTSGGGTDTDGKADGGDADLPPEFMGPLELELTGETSMRVSWPDAMDDLTATEELTYNVYLAESIEALDYENPRGATGPGIKQITLNDLRPGHTQYVVVRAVDEIGQESTNDDPYSAKTLDGTPPMFGGIGGLTALSGSELEATWTEANDAGTGSSDMVYEVFVAESSGAQDFTTPTMTTQPGESSAVIGGLDEYTEYFVTVRAVDESGNRDMNFVERSARTLDDTPPTFGGATDAIAAGAAIQIQWDPASDNIDDVLDIRYNIYANVDSTPGLVTPTATTIPGAASYALTNLPLNTNYKIIVRAEDTSGNEDDNTIEVSATTGASADESPPTFNGIVLLQPTGPTTMYAAWDPAMDDTTAQANIVYDVYVATSDGGHNFTTPTLSTAPGVTNSTLTGLLPDTSYWVVVRARDISGNQDQNTVQAVAVTDPDTTAPTFAGIDAVQSNSPTTLQLTWTDASDNVSAAANIVYYVYGGPDAGSVDYNTAVQVTGGGDTTWTMTGLEPKTQMCFTVRAEDEYANQDANTKVECGTSQADTTPPTFTGIGTATATDEINADITWPNASDDVDPHAEIVYLVYWRPSGGTWNFGSPDVVTAPGANAASLSGLPAGDKVDFLVRAQDEAGNVNTNTKLITVEMPADTKPPTFGGANNITATSTSVEVFWNQAVDYVTPANAIRYEVCGGECTAADTTCKVGTQLSRDCTWFTDNPQTYFPVTTASVQNVLSHPVTGQNPNQKMFYQVRAVDEAGNASDWGSWVSATTLTDVTPPTFAGIATATVQGPTSIALTWAAGSDVETDPGNLVYDVYWNTSNSFNFNSPNATTPGGALNYTINGLSPNTQYYMVVKARDQASNRSSNTAATSRTTQADNTPPDPVTLSSVNGGECDSISVFWQAGSDNATVHANLDYQICASTSSIGCDTNFAGNIKKTVTGATSTTIDVTAGDGTWYVQVRARDESNNIGTSNNELSTFVNDTGDPYWGGGSLTATRVVPSTNVGGRVQLNWPQAYDSCISTSSVEYEVCWSTSSTSCLISFTANAETYSESRLVTGLDTDRTYYFRVRPKDNEGNVQTSTKSDSVKTHTSYNQDIYPSVFNHAGATGGCQGCHHSWTRGNTLNVNGPGACSSTKYIVSGSPSSSIIYGKMTGGDLCGGSRMPSTGYYSSTKQSQMYNWIIQGANNN